MMDTAFGLAMIVGACLGFYYSWARTAPAPAPHVGVPDLEPFYRRDLDAEWAAFMDELDAVLGPPADDTMAVATAVGVARHSNDDIIFRQIIAERTAAAQATTHRDPLAQLRTWVSGHVSRWQEYLYGQPQGRHQ